MGYTHYWEPEAPIPADTWALIVADATKLIAAAATVGVAIQFADDDDDTDPPICDGEIVSFNGVGSEAYETFGLSRTDTDLQFCKTANKPYDLIVVAVLCTAAEHHPTLNVSSDGVTGDWEAGLQFARRVLEREVPLPARLMPD